MPKTTSSAKRSRINRVLQHLQKFPEGLKEKEIADELNMERRTVNNYLTHLEREGRIYKDGVLWKYDTEYRSMTLRQLELSVEEAMIIYLAARLFVKQSDKRNVQAENVLLHIAQVLSEDAKVSADIVQAAQELAERPEQDGYEDIFRAIIRSYLYRHRIEIIYHPYKGQPFQTVIEPYLIEPSSIGFSTYVIAYSSAPNALRTYKIERIAMARKLVREPYTIPDDFEGLNLLRNAWSIFYGEETVQVMLRFSPNVAKRVRETNWHPSQSPVEDDPDKDGFVRLSFEVADTTDLKPWIRTWGANCEVLAPSKLRDELMGEARRLAELYGWDVGGTRQRYSDIF